MKAIRATTEVDGTQVHASVTADRVLAMAEESMVGTEDDGICIACGEDAMGVEPDAEQVQCQLCGELAVYGGEQLLLLGVAG